jgi:hypothetical protein
LHARCPSNSCHQTKPPPTHGAPHLKGHLPGAYCPGDLDPGSPVGQGQSVRLRREERLARRPRRLTQWSGWNGPRPLPTCEPQALFPESPDCLVWGRVGLAPWDHLLLTLRRYDGCRQVAWGRGGSDGIRCAGNPDNNPYGPFGTTDQSPEIHDASRPAT